ncbi:MAG: hypothetical protein JWO44_325 [Bacteroidetes bacterium]|jgi:Na+-translocating ferredoxin:NAD+ oxidoreductase RnfG subunit|nr:hypothetical protein [Bacteroidota bacterium]
MKKLGLMMAFVALVATAVDANTYFPKQDGKTTSKSQPVKTKKKPVKKVVKKAMAAQKDPKIDQKNK